MNLIIDPSFYDRDTTEVARDLIGKLFIREYNGIILSGIIIETESYTADDPACHAYKGITQRNQALFGPTGHAYVYVSYGMHHCLNVVARSQEMRAGGVLIRAITPITGIETMKSLRRCNELKILTNGPGKLTQALSISLTENGMPLGLQNGIAIGYNSTNTPIEIITTPRIGISKAKEKLWRFTALAQLLQCD